MTQKSKPHLHNGASGAAITVRVLPKSSQVQIGEVTSDGTVFVHVQSTDCGEAANKELVAFLSELLKVPASKIEIVAGAAGQDKLVTIIGVDTESVQEKILKLAK